MIKTGIISKLSIYLVFAGYLTVTMFLDYSITIDLSFLIALSFLSLLPRFSPSILLQFGFFTLVVKFIDSKSFDVTNDMALIVYVSLVLFVLMKLIEINLLRRLSDENKLES